MQLFVYKLSFQRNLWNIQYILVEKPESFINVFSVKSYTTFSEDMVTFPYLKVYIQFNFDKRRPNSFVHYYLYCIRIVTMSTCTVYGCPLSTIVLYMDVLYPLFLLLVLYIWMFFIHHYLYCIWMFFIHYYLYLYGCSLSTITCTVYGCSLSTICITCTVYGCPLSTITCIVYGCPLSTVTYSVYMVLITMQRVINFRYIICVLCFFLSHKLNSNYG